MEQIFKIYNEAGREEAINMMIERGWRIVSFSQSAAEATILVISVLFEREKKE
jgi:hypothetical protein